MSIRQKPSRRFRKKTRNSISGRTAFCRPGEKGTEAEGRGRALVEESLGAEGRFSGEKFPITLSSGRMSVNSESAVGFPYIWCPFCLRSSGTGSGGQSRGPNWNGYRTTIELCDLTLRTQTV